MTEYYHTLLEKGGRILRDGEVVQETDYQILGHKKNEAQTPPEKKWLGWKKAQGFPHPTFVRMPEASCQMTTDEIIKLAREADPFGEHGRLYQVAELTPGTLERFAALVRNAVLDEAIKIIEEYRIWVGNSAAGELERGWALDALEEIRDMLRAMQEQT